MIDPSDRELALRIGDYVSQICIDAVAGREEAARLDPGDLGEALTAAVTLAMGSGTPPMGSAVETLVAVRAAYTAAVLRPLAVLSWHAKPHFPFFGSVGSADDEVLLEMLGWLAEVARMLASSAHSSVAQRAQVLADVLTRYRQTPNSGPQRRTPPHRVADWADVATEEERRILPELDGTGATVTSAAAALAQAAKALSLDPAAEVAAAVLDWLEGSGTALEAAKLDGLLTEDVWDLVQRSPAGNSRGSVFVASRSLSGPSLPAALETLLGAAPLPDAHAYVDARLGLIGRLERHVDTSYFAEGMRDLFVVVGNRMGTAGRPTVAEAEAFRDEMTSRHRDRQQTALTGLIDDRLRSLPGQAEGKLRLREAMLDVATSLRGKVLATEPEPLLLAFVGPAGCGQELLGDVVCDTLLLCHGAGSAKPALTDTTWANLVRDSGSLLPATDRDRSRVLRISGSPESCEPALAALQNVLTTADTTPVHVIITCSEQEFEFLADAVKELSARCVTVPLHAYEPAALASAAEERLAAVGVTLGDGAAEAISAKIVGARAWGDFRNLRLVERLTETVRERLAGRRVVEAADVEAVADLDGGSLHAPEFSRALERLHSLIGLDAVKAAVTELMAEGQFREMRRTEGFVTASQSRHLVFTGNPGTAKTTVARLLGDIYSSLGLLSKGTMVEATREDLVSKYSGESATKTKQIIESAVGGVLFIDEAYQLNDEKSTGHEAIGTLLRMMEDYRHDLVVVVAGYPKEMTEFLNVNPGLRSRFPRTIHFADYSVGELTDILLHFARENGFEIEPALLEALQRDFAGWDVSRRQGNAREVRNVFERLVRARALSAAALRENAVRDDLRVLRRSDFDSALERRTEERGRTLREALDELDELTGLESVKEVVHTLTAQLRLDAERRRRGLPRVSAPINLVFQGNPGTGKTTVARLLSRILAGLGAVESGHLIEVSRADLVAEYIGQTAPKVLNVVSSARGGVLFIDEADSLDPPGHYRDFGSEALTTLMTAMESFRNDLVVILAGESEKMESFLQRHPAFAGRFSQTVDFPDYSEKELLSIFESFAGGVHLRLDTGAADLLVSRLAPACREDGFDNARMVRTVFEQALRAQARRVTGLLDENGSLDDETLTTLTRGDIDVATADAVEAAETGGGYL